MRLKYVSYDHDGYNEYDTGTCEYCMGTISIAESNPRMTFEDTQTNEMFDVDMYDWEWGDYYSVYIENIPEFIQWLYARGVTDREVEELKSYYGFGVLDALAHEFQYGKDDEEFDDE